MFQPPSLPTTHTTLASILTDLDNLRDRVQALLNDQAARRAARANRYMSLGPSGITGMGRGTANPYEANASHHQPYDPWSMYQPTSPTPTPVRPRAILSPKQADRGVRYRGGLGSWQAPVKRAPPRVRRSAPERRGRDGDGTKGKGRKRRRVESEESSEESGSGSEEEEEGSGPGDMEGDGDEGRSGGEGMVVGK
jgi:hypothetical protein